MREAFFSKRDEPFARNLAKIISKKLSTEQTLDSFSSIEIPGISIEKYLLRFLKYIDANRSLYVLMLVYLEKYTQMTSIPSVNIYSIHRLIACSLLMASKFSYDSAYKTSVFAKVAGVPNKQMNRLEYLFFSSIQFKLYVDIETNEVYEHAEKIIDSCDSNNSFRCN